MISGERNLFAVRDLSQDMGRLKQLLELFERKTSLVKILDLSLRGQGVQIFIGGESGVAAPDDVSVVTSPYKVDGEVVGTVGVIGPTRMAYERVVPIVDVTAKLLSSALSQALKSVLLVNLGTPAAPTPQAVRRYLAEFLSDPRVVKLPRWLWLPILHGIVLRTRPAKSAHKVRADLDCRKARRSRCTPCGRRRFCRRSSDIPVKYAMRYGQPSITTSLKELAEPCVIPLYPQYSESTTASIADLLPPGVPMLESFHDHPAYIAALAANVQRHWQAHGRGELLVMSFHGLPKKGSERYEKECRTTARLLAENLRTEHLVTFQSRFGYAEWLQPYTEPTLVELARPGSGASTSSARDSSPTASRRWRRSASPRGAHSSPPAAREFYLVSCLNESSDWISALAELARGIGYGARQRLGERLARAAGG